MMARARTYQEPTRFGAVEPTRFGAVYASRLLHEIDTGDPNYARLRTEIRDKLDLHNRTHSDLLLKWLNNWNSRIKKASFPIRALRRWQDEWRELPRRDLAMLRDSDLDVLVRAYAALVRIPHVGPTIGSKVLFVACPRAAMMWDNAIRGEFRLNPDPDGYRELLERSRREAEVLIEDAESCGVGVQEAPTEARARTLSKVLDAYHWITITRRHTIPSRKEVQQWLKWVWR